MFVTGDVSLWKGVANIQGPFMKRVPAVQNNPANEWLIMVERTYLVSSDCLIAACKVQLPQSGA